MSEPETCPERVCSGDTWNSQLKACGKPAKRGGLCGVHANVKDRETERKARRDAIADVPPEDRWDGTETAEAYCERVRRALREERTEILARLQAQP